MARRVSIPDDGLLPSAQRVIGLDLSLNSTGYCIWARGYPSPVLGCIRAEEDKRGLARIEQVYQQVKELVQQCDVIAIEGVAMTKFLGRSHEELIALNYLVRRYIYRQPDCLGVVVNPGTLKKFATGNGKAGKDEMRLHVYKRWGVDTAGLPHDVADAVALSVIAAAIAGWKERPVVEIASWQRNAITKGVEYLHA